MSENTKFCHLLELILCTTKNYSRIFSDGKDDTIYNDVNNFIEVDETT